MRTPVATRLAVAAAMAHTLILAAYVAPAGWIPVRQRFWSQAYARVLFHQDWRLFAPDPPECGCSLEFQANTTEGWKPMEELHDHFIWRRMAANGCRFAEASTQRGDTMIIASLALTRSLEEMTEEVPRKGPLQFQLCRPCDAGKFYAIRLQPHR